MCGERMHVALCVTIDLCGNAARGRFANKTWCVCGNDGSQHGKRKRTYGIRVATLPLVRGCWPGGAGSGPCCHGDAPYCWPREAYNADRCYDRRRQRGWAADGRWAPCFPARGKSRRRNMLHSSYNRSCSSLRSTTRCSPRIREEQPRRRSGSDGGRSCSSSARARCFRCLQRLTARPRARRRGHTTQR